jgi:hypothetical protein
MGGLSALGHRAASRPIGCPASGVRVVAALATLAVIMAGVIDFRLFVAGPTGAAGGCGGG